MRKIVIAIASILVICIAVWYIQIHKYDIYFYSPIGYIDYSFRNNKLTSSGSYNTFYLNTFSIEKPVIGKFSNRPWRQTYVFSESVIDDYLKDSVNFIKRNDVYECGTDIVDGNEKYEIFNWSKVSRSLGGIYYDDYWFNLTFKYRKKIGNLEIYDFIIAPKGFIFFLHQQSIQEFYGDNIVTVGWDKIYKPYVKPYFSLRGFNKYFNIIMENEQKYT